MTTWGSGWEGETGTLARHLSTLCAQMLEAYAADPLLIREHVGIEEQVRQGGYGRRQLFELVQNGADALEEGGGTGRIAVCLTRNRLYCANEGEPLSQGGSEALLRSSISPKKGDAIGRFGQGFKSILQSCDSGLFLSRSCSFVFDSERAAERIRDRTGQPGPYPVLRLADAVDPLALAGADRTLADLMPWADTVVVLTLREEGTAGVAEEVRAFPEKFLLFCPQVRELVLDDRLEGRTKRVSCRHEGNDRVVMQVDEGEDVWRIFRANVGVDGLSPAERGNAGPLLRGRASVPLIWAVPTGGKKIRGQFWAFAPTKDETTLAGLLNAPWKTNNDRQNLLEGAYNERLLKEMAWLVVNRVGELSIEEDPAAHLDVLPAVQSLEWADEFMSTLVWKELESLPVLPDFHGGRAVGSKLRLPPDELPPEVVDLWRFAVGVPASWAHPSVLRRDRFSRAKRLGAEEQGHREWLESFVARVTPENSALALRAAAAICERDGDRRHGPSLVEGARIVLADSGELAPLDPSRLTIDAEPPSGGWRVEASVVSQPGTREALERLGISDSDPESLLKKYLENIRLGRSGEEDWEAVWLQARRVENEKVRRRILEQHHESRSLQVRSAKGTWGPLSEFLLPGGLFQADDEDAAAFLVDVEFHHDDLADLRFLGGSELPASRPMERLFEEGWAEGFLEKAVQKYHECLAHDGIAKRPNKKKLTGGLSEEDGRVGPLSPVHGLKGRSEKQARYLGAVLGLCEDLSPFFIEHETNKRDYPRHEVMPHPLVWLAGRLNAAVPTSLGPHRLDIAVSPRLERWKAFLPVMQAAPRVAGRFKLPEALGDLTKAQWELAFEAVGSAPPNDRGDFLIAAAKARQLPETLTITAGGSKVRVPRASLRLVTADPGVAADGPCLVLGSPQQVEELASLWRIQPPQPPKIGGIEPIGPSELLGTWFPDVVPWARELRLQPAVFPDEVESGGVIRVGDTLYYDPEFTTEELREEVLQALELPPDSDPDPLHAGTPAQRRGAVRAKQTLEERLLAAVGVAALRSRLTGEQLAAVSSARGGAMVELSDLAVAGACLALLGSATLSTFRGALERARLDPPVRWAGGPQALSFVRQLGFPDEFAGAERRQRRAFEEAFGPRHLPPLHDFQEELVEAIRVRLRKRPHERGLLALPTGAGKTRIAIEAITSEVTDRAGHGGYVLWVAQTDELCEQAVQGWLQVWEAKGPPSRLRVDRLWGGQARSIATAGDGALQVVVSTYQTLQKRLPRLGERSLDSWLLEPAVVVLDEAHHSIAPTYTDLLERLRLTHKETARTLLGLTATPFRGDDQEESRRLALRYGPHRFDHAVFGQDADLYELLQQRDVLARVDHDLLEGAELELDQDELKYVDTFSVLPSSVESRLARNSNRNVAILDRIEQLDPTWPVLVFAASVAHAEALAVALAVRGIPARPISALTDRHERVAAIEAFRRGGIRVLTNYNVLATGFDAPALRAVVVARPVWSRGLYQQMIGRGLRGPANGGKERCLLLNVADNLVNYGKQLAFRHFEHLWGHQPTTGQGRPMRVDHPERITGGD